MAPSRGSHPRAVIGRPVCRTQAAGGTLLGTGGQRGTAVTVYDTQAPSPARA